MNQSKLAWTNVWNQGAQQGTYAFEKGRHERGFDKIGHCHELGVDFQKGEKVLEAGCGDGTIILALKKLYGVDGYGVDFAESAQRQACDLMKKQGISFSFALADIRALPYEDNFFDKVICLGVIEHMEDVVVPLMELYRVLKPGGQAIIMTPNLLSFGCLDRTFQEALGLWKMGYQKEISPRELSRFIKRVGFTNVTAKALMRKSLPNDNRFRKITSILDRATKFLFSNWGFYSYTVSSKR